MEFLSEIFVKFWKEVIVAVMLTAILPFIRAYVRRQRAKMLNFFREKERLKKSLLEEETKHKEAEAENERLRAALELEQKAHKELEQKYQAEAEERLNAKNEAQNLKSALEQEQKAREETERKYQAELRYYYSDEQWENMMNVLRKQLRSEGEDVNT